MTWRCGAPWQEIVLSDTSDEEPPEEEAQPQLLLASDDLLELIIERYDPSLSVRVAGRLLLSCKTLFWRVSSMCVSMQDLQCIPCVAMVFNMYLVLSCGRYERDLYSGRVWSADEVQAVVADRVVTLACDVNMCQDVRRAASQVVHRVWRRYNKHSQIVHARMDAVPPEHVLSGPFTH